MLLLRTVPSRTGVRAGILWVPPPARQVPGPGAPIQPWRVPRSGLTTCDGGIPARFPGRRRTLAGATSSSCTVACSCPSITRRVEPLTTRRVTCGNSKDLLDEAAVGDRDEAAAVGIERVEGAEAAEVPRPPFAVDADAQLLLEGRLARGGPPAGRDHRGRLGPECREGSMHLFDDMCIVENVDDDCRPVPPGEMTASM